MSLYESLQRRRRACDLRAEGLSCAAIQRALLPDAVGLTTIKTWVKQPRPTDAELADALGKDAKPAIDCTGQVGFKMRFPPDLYAALKAEAAAQGGAPMNKVVGCAVRLYVECMSRIRTGAGHPVDLLGFRP